MTINEQLHNSATHKTGLDSACPVCNELARVEVLKLRPQAWQGISGEVYEQNSVHWKAGNDWVEALGKIITDESRNYQMGRGR